MGRKEAFSLLIKDSITVLLFYFIAKNWWGEEGWFQDKGQELLAFLLIGVVFYVLSLGLSIVTRPIVLQISQTNKHFGQDYTNFSIVGRSKTQEHERMVQLQIYVSKQNSIWGWVLRKSLTKFNLSILVESVTPGIVLEADNELIRSDIDATTTGFEIKIHRYLDQIIKSSNVGSNHNKGCDYLISEDPTNFVTEETINVTPTLLSNGKPASSLLKFIIRFDTPEHVVNFRWEV